VPRYGSSVYFKLYASHNNHSVATGAPYHRTNYFVAIYVDDTPLPIKNMHCQFDGDRYRCNWENLASFLDSRSLPRNQSLESLCFGHLEGRDRPQIIDGNVPWWLAAVIAVSLVVITLYYLSKWMKKKEQVKREEEAHLIHDRTVPRQPVDEFNNV